ncbi:hypothetical protein BVI1335_2020029 [Burkholderia vietnamiensis]|nr:hypothetical protein BVI1335_2020029 [Burkholderia vietnamiensis]
MAPRAAGLKRPRRFNRSGVTGNAVAAIGRLVGRARRQCGRCARGGPGHDDAASCSAAEVDVAEADGAHAGVRILLLRLRTIDTACGLDGFGAVRRLLCTVGRGGLGVRDGSGERQGNDGEIQRLHLGLSWVSTGVAGSDQTIGSRCLKINHRGCRAYFQSQQG